MYANDYITDFWFFHHFFIIVLNYFVWFRENQAVKDYSIGSERLKS